MNQDIKQAQLHVLNHEISVAMVNGETVIQGIDEAIQQLYRSGYMHNHCCLYAASSVCNIGKSYWLHPAEWMYYPLLDGD